MKVIAVMQVDLDVTPIGTRSRLGFELGGVTVLRRTIEQIKRMQHACAIYVLCPEAQMPRCRFLTADCGVTLVPCSGDAPPWRSLVASARKWSLDGWRGGIGGAVGYDEFVDCRALAGLLDTVDVDADAVLCVPPDAPLLSPELSDGMIDLLASTMDDSRMIFCQAPPGLSGLLLQNDLIREVGGQNMPIGWVFSYKPDMPQKDLIFLPCCYEVPPELRYAAGRLVCDTDRSVRRVMDLMKDHPGADARTIGTWLQNRDAVHLDERPREIEIELTTADPFPENLLRPRGDRVPSREPISTETVEAITRELCEDDDALIVLGGFGDPLRHPRFVDVLSAIRRVTQATGHASSIGLCVRTAGVDLSDAVIDGLIEHGVDVLQVTLDAWTPELYDTVHACEPRDGTMLERVCARLDQLSRRREVLRSVRPILVPDFVKAKDNLHEMDAFHNGWIRRHGAVSITGYSHHAGQLEDRSVMRMCPPTRTPCRRVRSRAMVLSDGVVTMCDQDFHGAHPIGRIGETGLTEMWCGRTLQQIRGDHQRGRYDTTPLCAACDEWHRP